MNKEEVCVSELELFSRWQIWLAAGRQGLRRVHLGGGRREFLRLLEGEGLQPVPGRWTGQAETQLRAYLRGELRRFELRLDPPPLGDFSRRVLRALSRVGWGQTITYGELAARAGFPGAARAVGAVMAANPLPIIWPCHRVVGRNGLTGFSAGLALKRALLEHEGAVPGRKK
jgi:methylated-DNA-[protein]-cysteine S-methyltransferase